MKSTLAIVEINNVNFMIHASNHALGRMAQRKINKYAISGSIIALGNFDKKPLEDYTPDDFTLDGYNPHKGIKAPVAV